MEPRQDLVSAGSRPHSCPPSTQSRCILNRNKTKKTKKILPRVRDVRILANAIVRLVPRLPCRRKANTARLVSPRRNFPCSLPPQAFRPRSSRAFVCSRLGLLSSLDVRKIYGYLVCPCVSLGTVYHVCCIPQCSGNELVRQISIHFYISLEFMNWAEQPGKRTRKTIRYING